MTMPTSETLRESLRDKMGFCRFCCVFGHHADNCMGVAAAVAWDAQVIALEELWLLKQQEITTIRERLAEAERARRTAEVAAGVYRNSDAALRTQLAEAETTAKNYLASHTKALADDDPTETCAANHRGYIECARAVLAALAHDKETP